MRRWELRLLFRNPSLHVFHFLPLSLQFLLKILDVSTGNLLLGLDSFGQHGPGVLGLQYAAVGAGTSLWQRESPFLSLLVAFVPNLLKMLDIGPGDLLLGTDGFFEVLCFAFEL